MFVTLGSRSCGIGVSVEKRPGSNLIGATGRSGQERSLKSLPSRGLRFPSWKGDNLRMPTKKKSSRKPNAAFMKPVQPDAVLEAVVGTKPLPRTELTKKLWAYIKKNGLQDKKVRTQINADDALKAVFGGLKSVSMFEMTKFVSRHVKA